MIVQSESTHMSHKREVRVRNKGRVLKGNKKEKKKIVSICSDHNIFCR